jgi:hypothetical protein
MTADIVPGRRDVGVDARQQSPFIFLTRDAFRLLAAREAVGSDQSSAVVRAQIKTRW